MKLKCIRTAKNCSSITFIILIKSCFSGIAFARHVSLLKIQARLETECPNIGGLKGKAHTKSDIDSLQACFIKRSRFKLQWPVSEVLALSQSRMFMEHLVPETHLEPGRRAVKLILRPHRVASSSKTTELQCGKAALLFQTFFHASTRPSKQGWQPERNLNIYETRIWLLFWPYKTLFYTRARQQRGTLFLCNNSTIFILRRHEICTELWPAS